MQSEAKLHWKMLFHTNVLLPKTFVQLFMRTSQVVPRALVLVVVVGEPLERGAGLGCKLVLAESGARRWLHYTAHLDQVNPPSTVHGVR